MNRQNAKRSRTGSAALHALAAATMVLCAGLASPAFAQSNADRLGIMRPLDLVPPVSHDFNADSAKLSAAHAAVKRGVVAPQLQLAAILRRQNSSDWAHASGLKRSEVDAATRVNVEFRLGDGMRDTVLAQLQALGFENRFPRGTRLLQGWLPVTAIEQAGSIQGVAALQLARRVQHFVVSGDQTSQGVASGRIDLWHDAELDGDGLTVAVIDGFINTGGEVAALQASGDWPPDSALTRVASPDDGDFGLSNPSDHGMATLEIVYDIAPDATFIAYDSQVVSDWIAAIYDAVDNRGANIITASLGAPLDGIGDGTALPDSVAEAAEYAQANGVLVVNAAGNQRQSHYGGLYDSDGVSFTNAFGTYDGSHRFNPGNVNVLGETKACVASPDAGSNNTFVPQCVCLPNALPITMALHWDDWDDVDHDFDVLLYRLSGTAASPTWTLIPAGGSGNPQTGDAAGGQTPQESASHTTAGSAVNTSPGCPSNHRVYAHQISHVSGTASSARNLQAFSNWDMPASLQVHENSLAFPADSAAVISVAAIDAISSTQEDVSSEGPILAPGGGESTGSESLKPDLASFANVDTVTYGIGGFGGTSAAAPHVAGMAALLWQRMGGVGAATAGEVRAALLDLAGTGSNDLGDADGDTQHGEGRARFQMDDELVFVQQPSDTQVSSPINPPVEVTVLDDEGEPVLYGAHTTIDLVFSIDSSSGVATLSGNTSDVTVGVASFPTLSVDTIGHYTLRANAKRFNDIPGILGPEVSDGFSVTIANDPPVLVSPLPNPTSPEGSASTLNFGSHFSDPDGDTLTLSLSGGTLPSGLSMSSSGQISGTIGYAAAASSPYALTVTAEDGNGGSIDAGFTWTVTNTNRAPTVICDVPNQSDAEADSIDFDFGTCFSDPDGDTLTFSVDGTLPSGLALTGAGRITGTIAYDAASESAYLLNAIASDGNGGTASDGFTWTVTNTNRAPTLGSLIPNQANTEGNSVDVDLASHFSDADGDTLTFSVGSALPAGLTLSSAGRVTGTIGFTAATGIPYTLVVTANDGNGGSASDTMLWFVAEAGNQDPVPTSPIPDQTHAEGSSVDLDLADFVSDPDGDTLTFSLAGALPAGLTHSGGRITGTIAEDASTGSPYSLIATIGDGRGGLLADGFTWTVTITNEPPVINVPYLSHVEGTSIDLDLAAYASDADGDPLTFSLAGTLPPGLSLSAGRITGTIGYDATSRGAGTEYALVVTADDGRGGVADAEFVWRVLNTNRAPILHTPLPDRTDAEGTTVDIDLSAYISDPDGDALDLYALVLPLGLSQAGGRISGTIDYGNASPGAPRVLGITVNAHDGVASLVDTFQWTLTHTNQMPTFETIADQTNTEGDYVNLDLADYVSDADGEAITLSASGLPAGLALGTNKRIQGRIRYTAFDGSPYTVTVTATDASGGSATESFTWTVIDLNLEPQYDQAPVPDQHNEEGDAVDLDIAANFANADTDGDTLTYALTGGVLPPGLSLSSEGRITGTIAMAAADGSPYLVTVEADDGRGLDSEDFEGDDVTFFWYVTDGGANRAPVLLGEIPDEVGIAGRNVAIRVNTYFADPDADTLTLSVEGLPPGLSLTADGRLNGDLDISADAGSPYTVTVTADDGRGGSVSDTFLWTVRSADTLFVDGFEAAD